LITEPAMVTWRRVNCYILTGGRSTRMGESKAGLFLEVVAAAAGPVFDAVIAVERADGERRSIETIFERNHRDEAPVFGVERAIEHAAARCFVLAVDYGRITSAVLQQLRAHVEKSGAPVVVPVWRGIPQTLCAGYSPAVAPLIARRIGEGKLDLLGLAGDAGAEMFAFDVPELVNINRPGDMEVP
jgi:molybdopterin-guanine dinucleotide biosynthesis protein A